jgi:hypothetical protein
MMFLAITSYNKDMTNDNEGVMMKTAYVLNPDSRPISDGTVTPVTLTVDKPRRGNVPCSDVSQAFTTSFHICGGKLNCGDLNRDGDFGFDGVFQGEIVTGGTYVAFTVNNAPGTCDKVGAVIVKGSNSANVYYYPSGILHDSGLASPINASGAPAGLSNLTFCLVECEVPIDFVVGFKSYVTGSEDTHVTTGDFITVYPLVLGVRYPLYMLGAVAERFLMGYLTIANVNNDGYWEITVDNSIQTQYQCKEPFLYVGSAEGFTLNYRSYPYPNPKIIIDPPTDTWTFVYL